MTIPGAISRSQMQRRRIRYAAGIAIGGLLIYWLANRFEENLAPTSYFSGYLMMGIVSFLAAYNARKKLSIIPRLGSSSQWMQLHIYVGLLSAVAFGIHVSWRFPNGVLERTLALAFASTFFSGVYGLVISRAIPRKLTMLRAQVIYEQIPVLKHQLIVAANRLFSDDRESNPTLERFYVNRVAAFLMLPRSMTFALQPSNRECRRLVDDITAMDRYLSPDDRERSRSLMQIVREKDDLDYQWALQSRLKYWLFLHIGLTYSLLLLAVVHGIMAQAFGGGMR
ncbi:MAG: hypothetical protein R3C03_22650 [Pirellulaceae bacterium]